MSVLLINMSNSPIGILAKIDKLNQACDKCQLTCLPLPLISSPYLCVPVFKEDVNTDPVAGSPALLLFFIRHFCSRVRGAHRRWLF